MKRFNKILAVVLVLSVFASFFAVTASAVEIDTTKVGYKFTFKDTDGNVINSAKAGDIVDLYLSMQTYAYAKAAQIKFYYDTNILTQIRQNATKTGQSLSASNCRQLLGDFADKTTFVEDEDDPFWQYEDENVGNGGYYLYGASTWTANPKANAPTGWTDEEKAKYQPVLFSYVANVADSTLLIHTNGEFLDVVRFRFYVNSDTQITRDVFGCVEQKAETFIEVNNLDVPISTVACKRTVIVPTISWGEPAAKKVYHVANQVQKNAEDASLINIGVKGGFKASDIAIAFNDAGTSTNVKNVGAKVTINGVTQTGTERFVYDVNGDGSEYQFRAVINGVDPSNASEIKVVLYVEMTDGTTHEANEVTISTSDIAALAAKVQ